MIQLVVVIPIPKRPLIEFNIEKRPVGIQDETEHA